MMLDKGDDGFVDRMIEAVRNLVRADGISPKTK